MIALARAAAIQAGEIIRASHAPSVRHKGRVDLVTQVDLACERAIRDMLERETPNIPILAEEGGGPDSAATRWIVDPLDGTTNFVHGFPFYCVSIALESNGVLEPLAIAPTRPPEAKAPGWRINNCRFRTARTWSKHSWAVVFPTTAGNGLTSISLISRPFSFAPRVSDEPAPPRWIWPCWPVVNWMDSGSSN